VFGVGVAAAVNLLTPSVLYPITFADAKAVQ